MVPLHTTEKILEMNTRLFPILSLALLSGCSSGVKPDQLFMNAAITADWLQTRSIQKNPSVHETNKILGESPDPRKVDIYFLSYLTLANTIYRYLPEKESKAAWALSVGTAQTAQVISNNRLEIKFNYWWK